LSAIPYNEGTHVKYFTKGREVYDEYYGYFIRCSDIFDERHKPIMQAKMIDWLRTADSDQTADWWERYWTGPWTLADCGYGNCTHQNHQEGSWRPLKRGTGCGAHGDKRQALATFVCHLNDYIRDASEKQEQKLIDAGRPGRFISNPEVTKREWDAISDLHPKTLILCAAMGLDAEGNEAYAELCADIILSGSADDPLYLRIQKFHRNKISAYVATGGKEEEYVWNLRKKYVAQIMVPSNRLMYTLDPKGTRKRDRVIQDLKPYQRDYHTFLRQHEPARKAVVDTWHIAKYLEVMSNFTVIDIIKGDASEQWGDLKYKCSCKACHVRGGCRENLLWSMVINHKLVMPPKWSRHQPGERKRRGRPTEKRLAKLKEVEDARPYVDKAKPRVLCSSYSHTAHALTFS
jgi:hypothetical protein